MIRIRKLTLVLLVAAGVICGGAGTLWVQSMGFAGALGLFGTHSLSGAQYDEYRRLADTFGKADELREYILDNYYVEVEEDVLDKGMLQGLFQSLDDPYSRYMDAEEYSDAMASLLGEYEGIGVTIAAGISGHVEVVSPMKGSPAEGAGLRTGDIIKAVDGVEYTSEDLDACAQAIRGDAGTDVTLTVVRGGREFDMTVTRAPISTESVDHYMMDGGIGYIQISGFIEDTASDFREALSDIEAQGAEGFVLDMRNNGGGLVDASVRIADMLMEKGVVAYTEDHDGKREYYRTEAGRTALPYVVLVDGGSASATEILSAGIQDNDEAEIVGVQTFGKGIIQNIEQLSDGSGVQMTILQYFSPSGSVIHGVGITPDHVVELTEDCYDANGLLVDDIQLKKAVELLAQPAGL